MYPPHAEKNMPTTMKHAYALICGIRSRPTVRAGLYPSRAAALDEKRRERQAAFIRREPVPAELWDSLSK
jgi:hypothetical protein